MTDAASVFNKIVSSRHSTRAYLPAEVPQALLDKVFDIAQWAPSNCNTQPWLTHIASGDVRDKLAGAMSGALMEGEISMDFPYAGV